MEITYFGHSALQLSTSGGNVLVDPFISDNALAEGVVKADELSPDFILLTHAHGDHWGDTASIATRTGAMVIANFEITSYLERETGHDYTFGMNTGGARQFPFGKVTVTRAFHSSSFPDGTYGGNPNGFIVEADGQVAYLAGDTAAFAEMAWLGSDYNIDVAFLPVGDTFTMGPEASLRAIKMLKPGLTVPIHYNTFPPIEIDVDAWEKSVQDAGFRGRVVSPGETITL